MISQIVASIGMRKNSKLTAIENCPLGEFPEPLLLDSELTASTRVRSHRPQVEVTNRDTEPNMSSICERLGLGQLIGVEIDVRVKIPDIVHIGKISFLKFKSRAFQRRAFTHKCRASNSGGMRIQCERI